MAEADSLLKEPPHSDDAELAVLGGVLIRNNALDQIADQLKDEHFYRTAHRLVYAAMTRLHEQRSPIDPITLSEALRNSGQLEEIGGLTLIDRLMDVTATSANIGRHANLIVEKAILRRLIAAANDTLARSYHPTDDVEQIVEQALASILDVSNLAVSDAVVPIKDIMKETIAHLTAIVDTGEVWSGVPSGFVDLDKLTNGFQRGDLIIVAARPAMGKTSFALNCAEYAAAKRGGGKTALFFSMEMPRTQIGLRLICSLAGVDMSALRDPNLIEAHFQQLVDGAQELYESKLYIDDTANLSVMDVRTRARRLKAEKGLDLVAIDYIQLMRSARNVQSREQEIAQISRGLKIMAKELNVPVIALAQLNRMVETRQNKRPMASDLRESGALEQDADVILMIYRDEVYTKEECVEPGIAEIIIAKHRNGPTGTAKLAFDSRHTRFRNLSRMHSEDVEDGY